MEIQRETQTSKKRAISLDLARGWMLLLIVLAHAPLFLYNAEPGVMSRPENITFIDTIVNTFGELFIDNRARPLFAVLFGYGLMMIFEKQILRGNSQKAALKTIRRRCWYLILFGIIFAVVIGGQDILMAYGIAGLLTAWLLPRDNKTLIKAAILITVIILLYLPLLWGVFLKEMGSYGFGVEVIPDIGYLQFFIEAALSFPIIPIFIHFLFPVLPSVLIGMWAGKKHLLVNSQLQHRTLKKIAMIGIMISIIGALPLLMIDKVWWPSLQTAGIIWGIHIITGIAAGIGYAALFGVIGNHIKNPGWLTYSLVALGKRSLTFFIFNETMLVILLSQVFFDLGGTLDNSGVTIIAIAIWIVAVVLAAVLEKLRMNGPLESAMQYLAYQKYKENPEKQKGVKY